MVIYNILDWFDLTPRNVLTLEQMKTEQILTNMLFVKAKFWKDEMKQSFIVSR